MLDALQAWVATYATREDAWSLQARRALSHAHEGRRVEPTDAALDAFAARWDACDEVVRRTGVVATG